MPEPHRYKDPTLQNHLASRYVLGKMQGRAKLRFEKLIKLNQVMARRVKQWEIKVDEMERLNEPKLQLTLPKNAVEKLQQKVKDDIQPAEEDCTKLKKQIWLYRSIGIIGVLGMLIIQLSNAFLH